MATVTIKRDPFARAELKRASHGQGECSWCGQHRRVYSYWWEADTLMARYHRADAARFCSVGCYRSYIA